MAFFELNSEITIGTFRFIRVHEVIIQRSLHNLVEQATIKIPARARVVASKNDSPSLISTGKKINEGDLVTIKLGYNGDIKTEFRGFVKRKSLNMPLEIECEGYSWILKRNNAGAIPASISLKDLLKKAVSGLDHKIHIQCDVDVVFHNVSLKDKTGFDVINYIMTCTDQCLTCFFIQPDVLWCGLLYTMCANGKDVFRTGKVNYQLGYNLVYQNSLKRRDTDYDPIQVKYNKRLQNGQNISGRSDLFEQHVRTYCKILNHLNEAPVLKTLADEKARKNNYPGYEGNLKAFLVPYAEPGYKVSIMDNGDDNGTSKYIIDGVTVYFGVNGARRVIEIGPKIG